MKRYWTRTVQESTMIICDDENRRLIIPCDERNADYQDFLAWVAAGNTAQEWQPEDAD